MLDTCMHLHRYRQHFRKMCLCEHSSLCDHVTIGWPPKFIHSNQTGEARVSFFYFWNATINLPARQQQVPHILIYRTLQLDGSEAAAIAAAARSPASVLGGGIMINGVKYMVLRADDNAVYCRKVHHFCHHESHESNFSKCIGLMLRHATAPLLVSPCNHLHVDVGDFVHFAPKCSQIKVDCKWPDFHGHCRDLMELALSRPTSASLLACTVSKILFIHRIRFRTSWMFSCSNFLWLKHVVSTHVQVMHMYLLSYS